MYHAVLTLDGTVQSLGEAIPGIPTNYPLKQLFLTSPNGNAAVYVGGAKSTRFDGTDGDVLSSTSYGDLLDATAAAVRREYGPFEAGAIDFNAVYVLGTNTQKLHILWIPW